MITRKFRENYTVKYNFLDGITATLLLKRIKVIQLSTFLELISLFFTLFQSCILKGRYDYNCNNTGTSSILHLLLMTSIVPVWQF